LKAGYVIAAAGALALGSLASAQTANSSSTKLLTNSVSTTTIGQQTGSPTPTPAYFTLRGGVDFSIDSELSDVSSILLGLGVDFTFSNNIFKNAETYLSIDWLARTHGNERFNLFPIALNERFYLSPNSTGKYGAGIGTAYVFVGLGGTVYDFADSNFRFSGRLGIGTVFANQWIAEATLFLAEPDYGLHADAIGLYVGYKFGG
jgi:hypothetical protein